jgi:uncharacterized protein (TIGR02001 family)
MIRQAVAAVAVAMVGLGASGAFAQSTAVYGGAEVELSYEEFGPNTGNNAYLSGYLEFDVSGLYAGIWGQVSDESSLSEVDLYLGYRNETAEGLSYDIGYARYTYPNDGGDCCGELTASLGVPVGDKFATSLDLAYDPSASLGNAYIGVSYQANDNFGLSVNYGVYEVDSAPSEREWDFGVAYALTEESSVDLRYYDGSEYLDRYIGVSLTWDTTVFSR